MRAVLFAIAAGAALAIPADAMAQAGRASGRADARVEQRGDRGSARSGSARGRTDDRRDDRYDRDRYERRDRDRDRYDDRYDDRRGNGPPFCRNGQGHPVHGRQWCRDKGWDNDRRWDDRRRDDRRWDDRRYDDRWDRVDWGRVIFRDRDRQRRNDSFGSSVLRDVLGNVVFGRLDNHSRRLGQSSRLDGRWLPYSNGYMLQVRSGGIPIARLIDANRDGRAETVLLLNRG